MVAPAYTPLQPKKKYTRDDVRVLESLPENADNLYELINGELYIISTVGAKMPPASHLHSWVTSTLMQLLVLFVAARGLGRVYSDGTGYDLPNGDILIPDLSFVSHARELPVMERGLQPIAPDLAIEIVSPSNSDPDIVERVDSYLSSGSRLVWVIYPKRRAVSVYYANAEGKVSYTALGEADTLTGEDILPEFETPVSAIFPLIYPASGQSRS